MAGWAFVTPARRGFGSYTNELGAGLVTDLVYLHSRHRGSEPVDLPYRRVVRALEERGVLELVASARPERIPEIRHRQEVVAAIVSSVVPEAAPAPLQLVVTDPMPAQNESSAPSRTN